MAVASIVTNRRVSFPHVSERRIERGSAIEVQEQDRLRISQELHDDLGQRLALLEMQLSQLADKCACPETAKGLSAVRERVGEMDQDLHRICCELYPVVLEKLGLVVALKSLCREFCQSGIRAEFVYDNNCPPNINKSVSLCLYRVVQEALHNVSKHSKAKSAKVSLRGASGRLEVIVEDSGIGFDVEPLKLRAGLGLSSIEERVRRASGRISISSTPGVGTQVRAVFYTFILVD